ncbi:MAG: lipocalin family protein [Pseudomonadota bacterium]|nr:lipocalin family protein [Pseudomonadota bacterium]
MKTKAWVLPLLMSAALLGACAGTPAQPLPVPDPPLQVERFLGRWYVIANIPYFFERGKVGTYVEYHPREDGRIQDLYFYREKQLSAPLENNEGVAEVVDKQTGAAWRAQFLWPLWFGFNILYVDDDYQTALVGHPDRGLGWIYARTPQIDEARLEAMFTRLEAAGYKREEFELIPQLPAAEAAEAQ